MKHYDEASVLRALAKKGVDKSGFRNTLMLPVDKDEYF